MFTPSFGGGGMPPGFSHLGGLGAQGGAAPSAMMLEQMNARFNPAGIDKSVVASGAPMQQGNSLAGGGQYQIQAPSWQNTGTTLQDVYTNKLGRGFDQEGFDFWQGRMNGVGGDPLSLDQVRQKIAGSAEGQAYQNANPAYNNFDFARDTMTDAANMMGQAGTAPPPQVNAQQMQAAPQINAQQMEAAPQINAMQMQNAPNINAQQIGSGQMSQTDLAPYMNPYTQAVTDTTMSELERQRLIAMNQTNSAASGAFGGSRHGIMQAETNRGFGDVAARTLAGLNSDNFMQAQAAGFQDIGNQFAADRSNQAAGLQSQIANASNAMQVGRNNQSADLQAQMTNAGNALDVGRSNQSAGLQSQIANAGNYLDVGRSNQSANLQSQLANASNAMQSNSQNLQGAAGLANISNMGFSRGQSALDAQMNAGNMQQQQQQQLIDAARQQTFADTGFNDEAIARLMSVLGGVPMSKTQTQSSNPGPLGLLAALL